MKCLKNCNCEYKQDNECTMPHNANCDCEKEPAPPKPPVRNGPNRLPIAGPTLPNFPDWERIPSQGHKP